jgi:hypothetical protein
MRIATHRNRIARRLRSLLCARAVSPWPVIVPGRAPRRRVDPLHLDRAHPVRDCAGPVDAKMLNYAVFAVGIVLMYSLIFWVVSARRWLTGLVNQVAEEREEAVW